jgi:uncharacterized repeat protein (TIGR01451 family)
MIVTLRFKILFSFVILMCQVCTFYGQDTIRIPSNFPKIQDALDIAKTNTVILVAPGTYYENLVWPSDIDGISLIGSEGSAVTIIDGGNIGRVIQMVAPVVANSPNLISQATLIKGFTIQHGKTESEDGAGIFGFYVNPVLEDLVIQHNEGTGVNSIGGGAYLYAFSGIIKDCRIVNNILTSQNVANGAGMCVVYQNDVEFINCVFENNVTESGMTCRGGGLFVGKVSATPAGRVTRVKMVKCRFLDNRISAVMNSFGGGLFAKGNQTDKQILLQLDSCIFSNNYSKFEGGAIYSEINDHLLVFTKFLRNEANSGGAIVFFDKIKATIKSCRFSNNIVPNGISNTGSCIYNRSHKLTLVLENVIMDVNAYHPIYLGDEDSEIDIKYCTFYHNEKNTFKNKVRCNAVNSIFWNHEAKEIVNGGLFFYIRHSIVRGGYFFSPGIIDEEPLFVNDILLIPTEQSPGLSRGLPTPSVAGDFQGYPRPMPSNSAPDLGAFEIDQYFAHIHVRIYYDKNQNGIRDDGERLFQFGRVKDQSGKIYLISGEDGRDIVLPQGWNSLTYLDDHNGEWRLTSQRSFVFFINSDTFSDQAEFGIYPEVFTNSAFTNITSEPLRCGEEVTFTLSLTNQGTWFFSGYFWIKTDERIQDIRFIDTPDVTVSDYEFLWNISELFPGQTITRKFIVTAPLINDPSQLDELYSFCHGISGLPLVVDDCYFAELRCAYDPNDKLASPQREDQLALIDKPVIYTVRFQNTGNDFARNVVIRDTLDDSFEAGTLKILHTSHPQYLETNYEESSRELVFLFKNIFLPDSTTNMEESNGHITYSIQNKAGIQLHTTVLNTALIYFDFNPPIVTNTTKNILVESYLTAVDPPTQNIISVFPNPASDLLTFSQKVDLAELYTLQGQCIQKSASTDHLMMDFPTGIYILRLTSEGKVSSYKITVVK